MVKKDVFSLEVVVSSVSYGRDMLSRMTPQPCNRDEIANTVYINGYDRETLSSASFKITLEELANLENRTSLNEGNVVRLDVSKPGEEPAKGEGNISFGSSEYNIVAIHPSNYHDLNMQITEFPGILPGSDPIDTLYELKGTLAGNAETGKKVSIFVRKDSFQDFIQPVRQAASFHPLGILQEEDARIFWEVGDALTFKSCFQTADGEYESMGWTKPMKFNAEVMPLSKARFYKHPQIETGLARLKVMFNTSHMIGRVCEIGFSCTENPDFSGVTALQIRGARKYGVAETPYLAIDSLEPA